jgi:hypothetical protein
MARSLLSRWRAEVSPATAAAGCPAPRSSSGNPWTARGARRIVALPAVATEVMVPAKKRRSPQEKKSLSYSRDRRNDCEYPKRSRRNIPRFKRRRHRAARRGQHQLLASTLATVDQDTQALVGERVMTPAPGKDFWARKWPDTQLGLQLARKLKRRADKDISAAQTEQARIAKVLRNTTIDPATSDPRSAHEARLGGIPAV